MRCWIGACARCAIQAMRTTPRFHFLDLIGFHWHELILSFQRLTLSTPRVSSSHRDPSCDISWLYKLSDPRLEQNTLSWNSTTATLWHC